MNYRELPLASLEGPDNSASFTTIGLSQALYSIAQWARRLGLDGIFTALLDATKTNQYDDYIGTVVSFLRQQESLDLLLKWSDESPCAEELSKLSQACLVSSFIAAEYPAMPTVRQVSRQLTGGLLTRLPAVALVARPIPAGSGAEPQWIATLRMWVFLQIVNSVFQGGRPNRSLVDVTQKLRLAIDRDENREAQWLPLFARLRGPTDSFHGMTRDLAAASSRLLADRTVPVESSVHRLLLSTLRNFCEGKVPESADGEGSEEYGLFQKFLDQQPQRSHTGFFPTPDEEQRMLLDGATPDEGMADHGLSWNFDLPGAEEAVLKLVHVDHVETPPEQVQAARGILLATAEDHQFLPFSWNRPSSTEQRCLEQWIAGALSGNDPTLQVLASFVELAMRTSYSLDTVLSLPLSRVLTSDWSIDLVQGRLHRLPPRRYSGWRVMPETAPWVEPIAEQSHVPLKAAVVSTLRRLYQNSPAGVQLKHLLPPSIGETPATLFNRICRETKGMERLRSGMLANVLRQSVFEITGDPVLSELMASHPRTGLGGACAYSSYQLGQVQHLLTRSTDAPADKSSASAEARSNAAGSELSPLDNALRKACEGALTKVNQLSDQPAQWIAHHNALTTYVVVVLLAATGARPVNSPFEAPNHFDWSAGALYIEDKVSSKLHAGRIVPIPDSVGSLVQNCYMPHLARLAQLISQIDPVLSDVLAGLSKGLSNERLPLFFLLGTEPTLRWFEVSEASLGALDIFSWPLPWNLMRHRLPTTLKRAGANHECINAITGHGENGTAAYGPYSMRIWEDDAKNMRQPLTSALLGLELLTPNPPQWAANPISPKTAQPLASILGAEARFGARARSVRRKAGHKKATEQAQADILDFMGKRPIDSLNPVEWEQLSQKMLFHVDGRPRTFGTLRYDALQHWISDNWQDSGLRPRIKRRYLPSLEEQSPFTVDAIGCIKRVSASLEFAREVSEAIAQTRPSKRESLALGILLLMVEGRIADPGLIKDLLQSKNFRLVSFQKRYHLEHATGLDKVPDAPVRRHEISATAAVLLARSQSSAYRLDVRQWPVADPLRIIGQPFGLDDHRYASLQACVLAIAAHVRQANALQYPGLVAGYLNGAIVSVGLHHADWVRVILGRAISSTPLTTQRSVEKNGDPEAEEESDAPPSEAINKGYVAWPDAFMSLPRGKPAAPPEIPQLQVNSFKFFQQIRDALNAELDSATPSRRDLDAKLRELISINKHLVSRSCLLLGEWQRSLLWRKTSKGLIRIRSLQRYLNALSVCFQSVAYDHDLLECDEDEVTDFYRRIIEIRQLIRPGSSSNETRSPPHSTAVRAIGDEEAEVARNYRSQGLALQLLRDFHRLVSHEFGVEDPDWSELSVGDELLSISPGMITEEEYGCALRNLASVPTIASREDLARAFILLTIFRFGLRGDEATGLLRSDWVDDQPDAIVLLVRTNRLRRLKSAAAQRQVPLLFLLTEHEKDVIASWLDSLKSVTTLDSNAPLFVDRQSTDKLMNVKQLRRDVGTVIKQVTDNPDLSPHSARHAFGNRIALLLLQRAGSIWPHAATTVQSNEERQSHVRRLLLGTDQVTRRSLWAVARLLGHAHPSTTVRSYLHFLPELAACYVNLPPPAKRPVSKHLSAACINLDGLAFSERYLQSVALQIETPAAALTANRALSFLHLCQRGVEVERAQQIVGISLEDATRLIQSVEVIDDILARRPAINCSMGGPYNLLSHIPQIRWGYLIKRAQNVNIEHPPKDFEITLQKLPELIGSSRQILLWRLEHFTFFRLIADLWKLDDASYSIRSTFRGRTALQNLAEQAELKVKPSDALRGEKLSEQIDSLEIGDPPMLVRHRCAVVAQTHEASMLRSNFELVLIVMVSIAVRN